MRSYARGYRCEQRSCERVGIGLSSIEVANTTQITCVLVDGDPVLRLVEKETDRHAVLNIEVGP